MTVATDIAALKARCTTLERRCTAVETKNKAQDAVIAALAVRVLFLEAPLAAFDAAAFHATSFDAA